MPLQAPESYIEPYRNISASKPRILGLKSVSLRTKLSADRKFFGQSVHGSLERATYSGMVAVLDEAIGNITSYLKENDIWEDTIIIFSNDNGGQAYAGGNNLPYRGDKGSYWEGQGSTDYRY